MLYIESFYKPDCQWCAVADAIAHKRSFLIRFVIIVHLDLTQSC